MVLVGQHDMIQPVSLQVLVGVKAEMAGGTLVHTIFYITISDLNFDTHFAAVNWCPIQFTANVTSSIALAQDVDFINSWRQVSTVLPDGFPEKVVKSYTVSAMGRIIYLESHDVFT
jgi:hypothetical protein